jgi:hypothetical protein
MNILEDLEQFFKDLKSCYSKEGREIQWDWDIIVVKDKNDMESMLFYMAFNLSKSSLHGPLPDHLHNRMMLSENEWSKAYFKYLDSWPDK